MRRQLIGWRAVPALLTLAAALASSRSPVQAASAGRVIVCQELSAVDGDTIKCDGVNMRDMGDGQPFLSGYDTPEIHHAKCQAELELGRAAKARMTALLASEGLRILDSGKRDKTRSRRPLVWITLADGRSVGSVLIEEGLAADWTPGYRSTWCSGG